VLVLLRFKHERRFVRKGSGVLDIMETVTLKIKSPSAAIPDLELNVKVEDTILEVKEKVSAAYPTKPRPSAQKLVYLGKILKDSERLSDLLRFEEECTAFTFHLVCAIPQKTDEKLGEGLRYRPAASTPADQASIPPPATYVTPNSQETMEEMMRNFSSQYSQAMTSLPSVPNETEIAAMQELYNQYLGLYMQYLGAQAPAAQYQHLVAPPGPVEQEVPQGVQEAPQVQVQGPEAGMVMNAGGGGAVAAEAAGDRNRDVLDWVYVMTRVVLLFSVIYFHSSFLRLAFVAGLGFLVFLYQNRQNGRVRRAQAAPAPPPPPIPEEVPENQENQEENQEAQEEEIEGHEAQEQEQPKPSKLAVFVTFVSSLVSSIIPEQNQVI